MSNNLRRGISNLSKLFINKYDSETFIYPPPPHLKIENFGFYFKKQQSCLSVDDQKKIGIQTSTLRKKSLTTVDKKDVSSSSLNDSSDP